jgi:hypothetical protein
MAPKETIKKPQATKRSLPLHIIKKRKTDLAALIKSHVKEKEANKNSS